MINTIDYNQVPVMRGAGYNKTRHEHIVMHKHTIMQQHRVIPSGKLMVQELLVLRLTDCDTFAADLANRKVSPLSPMLSYIPFWELLRRPTMPST